MLLKVVFLFYWKKNYFNHCLKSILTKKYCLLIFFFPFLLEILLKKKKRKQWLYTGVCSVPGYFDELYFQKGTSPQPTYITPDFYIPLIYEPSSPSIELYTPKDSSVSLNKANTLEKMFLWGRGKFKSKLHIIFELWKIQFLPIKKHCFN